MSKVRIGSAWFGVWFVGFLYAAPGQAGGQTEWQAILDSARKEGKVTVGIPASGELRRVLEKAFTERFKGIEIELFSGPASRLASRVVSESKAGVRNFDVFLSGSGSALAIAAEGLLEPFGLAATSG